MTTASDLLAQAEAVLRGNDVGDYTTPSRRLYPHQWNWDSAFVAIGWAHLDWPRAVREVDALLRGQWTDGMLPHIRYNPEVKDYAPGPEWWPDVPVRRAGEITSGISQPLILPTAVYLAGMLNPDPTARHAWWARIYEPLVDATLYFPRHRTTGDIPLIILVHPWESGLDNSPRWDFAVGQGYRPSRPFRRIDTTVVNPTERPTPRDYDLYMFLVELIASGRYRMASYLPHTPFAVYDAMFNAVWYRAATDLNRIAAALGRPPAVSAEALAAFARAYRRLLWSQRSQMFLDVDVKTGRQLPVHTLVGLTAIYAGLVDARTAAAMLKAYEARCRGCRLLPSVPPDQPGFESGRYHRGPVWIQSNWMIVRGLEDLGLIEDARRLAEATIELVRASGCHEYYEAYTGRPAGASDFSWTAALTIDLLKRPPS